MMEIEPQNPKTAVEDEIRQIEAAADQAALFLARYPNLIKHDGLAAMLDRYGDIGALIFKDTKYHASKMVLNGFLLNEEIAAGIELKLLSSSYDESKKHWIFVAVNEAFSLPDGTAVAAGTLHIQSTFFIWNNTAYREIELHNAGAQELPLTIDFVFDNQMTDIFVLRGERQYLWGRYLPSRIDGNSLQSVYEAYDEVRQVVSIRISPVPAQFDNRRGRLAYLLAAGEKRTCLAEIHVAEFAPGTDVTAAPFLSVKQPFQNAAKELARDLGEIADEEVSLLTGNEALNKILRRSASDLDMLVTTTDEGPFPMAGMPWFNAVFGRDSLITALLEVWRNPDLSKGVLLHMAANQADRLDLATAAEPGKIAHEIRLCEMARTRQVPYRRYYGSVDAPMLFVMLAEAHLAYTQDKDLLRQLWPNILAALEWMRQFGQCDASGFIKYHRKTKGGLLNQGWEDSPDSVFHADGALATGPVALIEVQGYAYAARRGAATIAAALGETAEADRLNSEADSTLDRIEKAYWDVKTGRYGMAIDDRGLCETLDSNMGQLLLTGAVPDDRARLVVDMLMDERFFSGWGIRTKATGTARYKATSYHNGTIWPHANALIVLGMIRYGHHVEAAQVFCALAEAAIHFDNRCPELFSGERRDADKAPESYHNANPVQAWASAAIPGMAMGLLGLHVDPQNKCATFERPYLPECFGGSISIRRLKVGEGLLYLRLDGTGYDVNLTVEAKMGGATARCAPHRAAISGSNLVANKAAP